MKDIIKALGEVVIKVAYPAVKPAVVDMIREGGADLGKALAGAVKATDTPWDDEAAKKLAVGARAFADALDAELAA